MTSSILIEIIQEPSCGGVPLLLSMEQKQNVVSEQDVKKLLQTTFRKRKIYLSRLKVS